MATTITGAPRAVQPFGLAKTDLDLDKSREVVKERIVGHVRDSGQQVAFANADAGKAFGALIGATVNAVAAPIKLLEGTGHGVAAAGDMLGAGLLVGLGGIGWVAEAARDGAREALIDTSRGMLGLRNRLAELRGDSSELGIEIGQGDASYVRFSKDMFEGAAEQVAQAGQETTKMFEDYGRALEHALAAGISVGFAGVYAVEMGAHLALAAGQLGLAAADGLAYLGLATAELAVDAADAGLHGSQKLLEIAAQAQIDVANALALPDKGKAQIVASEALERTRGQLEAYAKAHPEAAAQVKQLLAAA